MTIAAAISCQLVLVLSWSGTVSQCCPFSEGPLETLRSSDRVKSVLSSLFSANGVCPIQVYSAINIKRQTPRLFVELQRVTVDVYLAASALIWERNLWQNSGGPCGVSATPMILPHTIYKSNECS